MVFVFAPRKRNGGVAHAVVVRTVSAVAGTMPGRRQSNTTGGGQSRQLRRPRRCTALHQHYSTTTTAAAVVATTRHRQFSADRTSRRTAAAVDHCTLSSPLPPPSLLLLLLLLLLLPPEQQEQQQQPTSLGVVRVRILIIFKNQTSPLRDIVTVFFTFNLTYPSQSHIRPPRNPNPKITNPHAPRLFFLLTVSPPNW